MDEPKNENEVENYPLDEASITFFAEGRKAIDAINLKLNGGFELILKMHGLQGNWRLADNGRELEKIAAPIQSQK